MKKLSLITFVLLLCLASCVVAKPTSSTPTDEPRASDIESVIQLTPTELHPGKLSFISDQEGKPQIFLINDDGTGLIRLTNVGNPLSTVNLLGMFAYDWSPDGKFMAFVSDMDAGVNRDIYRMNMDDSSIVRLTFCEVDTCFHYNPTLSPDGTKIAFSSTRDKFVEVYLMNINGSNQERLTFDVAPLGDFLVPSWSPDGSKIAFVSGYFTDNTKSETYDGLYVVQADGSTIYRLIKGKEPQIDRSQPLAWSSDNKQIAFASTDHQGIYLVDVQDGSLTKIIYSNIQHTDEFEGFSCPLWLSDGKHIIYYYVHTAWVTVVEAGFYSIDINTLETERIANIANSEGGWLLQNCPSMSPDGNGIVFSAKSTSRDDEQTDLFIMNIEGTKIFQLTDTPFKESSPHWYP